MKYAVISDVHANLQALEKVLSDAKGQGAEAVVSLGDAVGYGPQPAEAVALLAKTCAAAVAGNHDDAVSGRRGTDDFIGLAADAAIRHREALDGDARAYLSSLPYKCSFGGAEAVHGDFTAPEEFLYVTDEKEAAASFAASGAQLLFCGHTHEPCLFVTGHSGATYKLPPQDFAMEPWKRYLVNPGSVGYPRETGGRCLSSYAIYDDAEKTVCFRFLPFSVSSVMQRGAAARPKRLKIALWTVCAAVFAAACAAYVAVSFRGSVPPAAESEAPEEPVASKTLAFPAGAKGVKPNLELESDPKSPPALLRVRYFSQSGEELRSDSAIVKVRKSAAIPAPRAMKGAAKVVLDVLPATPGGKPVVKSFDPQIDG